jgi:eukaryotic-like serine/threonine-protein kinase
MVSRPFHCDPEQLRRLLDDRLDEPEQDELAAHLESCPGCRRTLDAMAAGTHWWSAARAFLAPEPTSEGSKSLPADEDLSFLAPSEDPTHLGRIGPYEIVEVIGRGGMGVVLKGLDPMLNRFVAIKVLAPELATSATARRRFAREGQAAAAIGHDHIVAIHAVDTSGVLPYLVMQYVPGKSLQERVDRSGPLAVIEIVRIGMQAAQGLAAAHKVGLIHRDIKPSNILLENCIERVKISDFGLARAVDDASLTRSGVVAGTPQYMSPEQARGEPIDHRTDLFSLGSVLYALCTGRPPFRADSTMAVLRRVSDQSPRPIRELNPEIPDWLAAIVAKLHAKDPAERFQTAEEVADLLGRCLVYLREPTRHPLPFPVSRPRKSRRRLAIAAGLAILTLCGLGAAEAAGVTQVVATILRIKTTGGTLVIKVDDPDVKVKIDGEEIVITGAGLQEFRLKPGTHIIQPVKGDRVGPTQIIEIAKGGKETVTVGFEPDPATAAMERPGPDGEIISATPSSRSFTYSGTPRQTETIEKASLELGATIRGGALSPDGRTLALACEDGAIRIVDLATDRVQRALKESEWPVSGVAFTPDGKALAASTSEQHGRVIGGEVRLWDLATGKVALALKPKDRVAWMGPVAISPDGKTLVGGAGDGKVRLWSLPAGGEVRELAGHEGAISALAFAPAGPMFFTASMDGSVRRWSISNDQPIGMFKAHIGSLTSVAVAPHGRGFVAGGDGQVALFDWRATGISRIRAMPFDDGGVLAVAYSPDGKLIAAVGLRDDTGQAGGQVTAIEQKLKDTDRQLERHRQDRLEKAKQVEARTAAIQKPQTQPDSATYVPASGPTIPIPGYARVSEELLNTEIEIDKAEAKVEALQPGEGGTRPQDDPEGMKRMVTDLFYNDPRAASIVEMQEKARTQLEKLKRNIRDPLDPLLAKPRKDLKDATAALDLLWEELEPVLSTKVRDTRSPEAETLRAAKLKLAELQGLKERLEERLTALKTQSRASGEEAQRVHPPANDDLARLTEEARRLLEALAKAEAGLKRLRIAPPSDPFFDDPDVIKAQAKLEDLTRNAEAMRKNGKLPDSPHAKAAIALRDLAQDELDALWAKHKPGRAAGVRQAFSIEQAQKEIDELKRLQAVVDVKMRAIAEQQKARFPGALELPSVRNALQDQVDLSEIDREIARLEAERKNLQGSRSGAERPAVGVIKVWDVATGAERYSTTMLKGAFRFVAFTPDSKSLIAVSATGSVIVRDLTVTPVPSSHRR